MNLIVTLTTVTQPSGGTSRDSEIEIKRLHLIEMEARKHFRCYFKVSTLFTAGMSPVMCIYCPLLVTLKE